MIFLKNENYGCFLFEIQNIFYKLKAFIEISVHSILRINDTNITNTETVEDKISMTRHLRIYDTNITDT